MRLKYQVFVSSTFRGLEEERREVMHALLEMDCIPSGMELFPASSEEVWKLIESLISECDYYVLIISGRYGTTDTTGLSYTEREYELAIKLKIPIVAFLHKDPNKIEAGLTERDPVASEKLNKFRERIEAKHHCKYWINAGELSGQVSRAINFLVKTQPRCGWVRGDQAKTIADVEQLAFAEKRIRELEGTLNTIRSSEQRESETYAQGNDNYSLTCVALDKEGKDEIRRMTVPITWNRLFIAVAECTMKDPLQSDLDIHVKIAIKADVQLNATERLGILTSELNEIKTQFEVLGFIAREYVEHRQQYATRAGAVMNTGIAGYDITWKLTTIGLAQYGKLVAIRKKLEAVESPERHLAIASAIETASTG